MPLSVDKVTIGNLALDAIGVSDNIESFTENSKAARVVRRHYEFSRIKALEAFPWPFSTIRLVLSTHGDDAPTDWAYRYQYPANCVAAQKIINPFGDAADAVPFKIQMSENGETKSILTDMDDACLEYTFDQENTTLFTAHFVDLLAQKLAGRIAMPMTAKRSIKQAAESEFRSLMRLGMGQSADEAVEAPPRDADWIRARQG